MAMISFPYLIFFPYFSYSFLGLLMMSLLQVSDTLFTWADLQAKQNNELLKNLGNFVHRTLSFLAKPSGLHHLIFKTYDCILYLARPKYSVGYCFCL